MKVKHQTLEPAGSAACGHPRLPDRHSIPALHLPEHTNHATCRDLPSSSSELVCRMFNRVSCAKHCRYGHIISETHNTVYAHLSRGRDGLMVEMDRRNFIRASAVVAVAWAAPPRWPAAPRKPLPAPCCGSARLTDIDSLNPFTAFSTQSYDVLQLIYDKLMDYDAQLNIVPGLATARRQDRRRQDIHLHPAFRRDVARREGRSPPTTWSSPSCWSATTTTESSVPTSRTSPTSRRTATTRCELMYSASADPRAWRHHPDRAETHLGGRRQGRPAEVRQRKARRHRTVQVRLVEQGQRRHRHPQRLVVGYQTGGRKGDVDQVRQRRHRHPSATYR